VTLATPGAGTQLRNLATGEEIKGKPAEVHGRHRAHAPQRMEFKIEVPPHSFVALAQE
jgi:hypothetical protein